MLIKLFGAVDPQMDPKLRTTDLNDPGKKKKNEFYIQKKKSNLSKTRQSTNDYDDHGYLWEEKNSTDLWNQGPEKDKPPFRRKA